MRSVSRCYECLVLSYFIKKTQIKFLNKKSLENNLITKTYWNVVAAQINTFAKGDIRKKVKRYDKEKRYIRFSLNK